VERDDLPPVATFVSRETFVEGATTTLGEGAAHHARVKRLESGDAVRLTDGQGNVATGSIVAIRRGTLEIEVYRLRAVARPPSIHLRVPVGDRDRMLWLAEKAAELGVTTWQAVHFRRSASVTPRGEGVTFADKVRGRMESALEQSGGAWMPAVLPDATLDTVSFESGNQRILLDAEGTPLLTVVRTGAAQAPVILFGPEGGFERQERDRLHDAAWTPAKLAETTLRFETAGIAAIAGVRAAQMAGGG
jgi:16S rRNA (uracil1498-N3)-methyltransferase